MLKARLSHLVLCYCCYFVIANSVKCVLIICIQKQKYFCVALKTCATDVHVFVQCMQNISSDAWTDAQYVICYHVHASHAVEAGVMIASSLCTRIKATLS